MSSMLKHAVERIPYYKHLKGEFELSPDTVISDIKHFPIVTKEILGSMKEQFIDPDIPVIKSLHSGGTTMTRVSVNTGKYFETHKANEYFNIVAGIYPGMRRFIIARHEATYRDGGPNEKDIGYEIKRLAGTYFVSSFDFDEEKLIKAYEIFKKAKPEILKGNSAMLVEFAESIEKRGWEPLEVPIVHGSDVNMLPEYIKTLERVFKSKVFNAYGSTETGIVAAQCESGGGMHYIPNLHYLETVKDGRETAFGDTGSLMITSLANKAMPIIRYQLGDYATLSDKMCDCGRTYPMIESIDGRLHEVVNTSIGSIVSVYEIKKVISEFKKINDFQIVQISPDTMELNFECGEAELTEEEILKINEGLTALFECNMTTKIKYVDSIAKLPSGKILRVISQKRYELAVAEGKEAGSI
ncbi:MAG: hypothetical protein R6W99_10165 [Clostridia bacterium]